MREWPLEGLQGTWEHWDNWRLFWGNGAGRELALGFEPLLDFAKPRPGFLLPASSRVLEKEAHGIH